MLRQNQTIRLTPRDIARWIQITGFEPGDIHCLAQLDAYIERCKTHFWGRSRETIYLRWLMDLERELQLGTPPELLPPPPPALVSATASSLPRTAGENT